MEHWPSLVSLYDGYGIAVSISTRRQVMNNPVIGSIGYLYLLRGMGGDEDEWTTFGRAAQILDNLIAQGQS